MEDLTGTDFEIAQLAAEGFGAKDIALRVNLSDRAAAARIRVVFAKLYVRNRPELREKMAVSAWRDDLARIKAFIEAQGHSRVPEDYHDEDGPLAGLVGNLRRKHAGRSWLAEARLPKGAEWCPGVDWQADLDRLEGWSWEIEEPWEIPVLRSRRHEAPLIRGLGLQKTVGDLEYIRSITTALRESEQEPWPRLRQRVNREGVDTRTVVLADLFPTREQGGYLGLVVTPDRRAFSFYLRVSDAEQPEHGSNYVGIGTWRELSTLEEKESHAEQIRLGLQVSNADSP